VNYHPTIDSGKKTTDVHFFIHNSAHAGDVILARVFIKELQSTFPNAKITLECYENNKYLWEDFGLPILIYEGNAAYTEYTDFKTPTPNCPKDAFFINIWLATFPHIFDTWHFSYANLVHTFNEHMRYYNLDHVFQLPVRKNIPFVEFYDKKTLPFTVRENSVLIENGPVRAGQSLLEINDYLQEIADLFPDLNFYCSAPVNLKTDNIFDCSKLNLIELSEVSNQCIALFTRASGVNAAALTEVNRYKPRCIVGWYVAFNKHPTEGSFKKKCVFLFLHQISKIKNRLMPKCIASLAYSVHKRKIAAARVERRAPWDTLQNPFVYATHKEELKRFLSYVSSEKENIKKHISCMSANPGFDPNPPFESIVLNNNGNRFCKILRSKKDVEKCTNYLKENWLTSHGLVCKDWEIAHIITDMSDGNLLDMGSTDSYILKNALLKGINGEKYGIDLREPDLPLPTIKYLAGDLLAVPLPDGYFQNITCLSVVEHDVDIKRFAAETSRLLQNGGKLYVTFDYWDPKVHTDTITLYGLSWNIFDKNEALHIIDECEKQGLHLVEDMDWESGEAVIDEHYYSPAQVRYTFAMFVFEKTAG